MMETKAKPHHHTILLSDLEEAEVDKGLLASLTTWMHQMDKDKTGKVSKTGSRVLVTKTKMTYQNIFSQLEHFFFKMIGDYDSLLILQDHPPENCISMKVESLLQFVDYKFGKKDTQQTDMCGCPVQSVNVSKTPLSMCTETWHAPKKINQFCDAVKIFHLTMGHSRDPYREACRECRALPVKHHAKAMAETLASCTREIPLTRVFYDKKQDIKTLLKDYKTKAAGCSQLLPSYVQRMRERLISSNTLIDFQIYVIILVAIKLFLPQDEFGDIKIDHFVPELFVVKEGGVIGLLVKVFGKCDDNWVHLYLWLDEDYPELCAVRHLLVYLFLIGIKGGFLFPAEKELLQPPQDGVYMTTLSANAMQTRVKKLCKEVLKHDIKCGLHMFRKTAYLFARPVGWCF